MKQPLKVILGHSFCNQSQANEGQHNYRHIISLTLSLKFRKKQLLKSPNMPLSTTPLSFEVPPRGTPASIDPHIPCIFRNQSHWPTFLSLHVWVYLHSILCSGLQNTHLFRVRMCLAVQGHSGSSEVDDFGINRKCVYDFLLVGHSNYGSILPRF